MEVEAGDVGWDKLVPNECRPTVCEREWLAARFASLSHPTRQRRIAASRNVPEPQVGSNSRASGWPV